MEGSESNRKKDQLQDTETLSNSHTVLTIIDTNVQREFQNILITGGCEQDQLCCSGSITEQRFAQSEQKHSGVIQVEESSPPISTKDNLATVPNEITGVHDNTISEAVAQSSDTTQGDSLTNLFDELGCSDTGKAVSPLDRDQTCFETSVDLSQPYSDTTTMTNEPKPLLPLNANQQQSKSPVVTNLPQSNSPVLTNEPQSSSSAIPQLPQSSFPVTMPQHQSNSPRATNQPGSSSAVITNLPQTNPLLVTNQQQLISTIVTNQPQSSSPMVTNLTCAQPSSVINQQRMPFSPVHSGGSVPAASRRPHILNIPNDSIILPHQRTDALLNIQDNSTNRVPQLTGPPPSYSKSLLDRRINPCTSIQFVAPIPPPSYDGVESELRYAHTLGRSGGFTLGLGNTWQGQPQPAYCPVCETVIITQVDLRVSRTAHIVAMIMFLLFFDRWSGVSVRFQDVGHSVYCRIS
ncbi:uncharacterized protein LOC128995961 isoform X2 [Macrosteles quadrilineatus]|uniref:uncharacterized protein LOC128995961 isoform X2 n=1 Tax=Macrosteles quadrilineatus TaxID=74068 RepID=UPI0023E23D55|nr:uncharacterized protein LOC128995961 isoform X2 [Macrosteles quadrilineatus]